MGNTGVGGPQTDTDSVNITVSSALAVNAGNDSYATTQNASLAAGSVLSNDTDPLGGTLSASGVNGSGAAIGNTITLASGALLTMNADGTFVYDPNGAFNSLAQGASANDSFTYDVSSTSGGSGSGTVGITINGVNDAPVLSGANNLSPINEDPAANPGTLVSALIAGQVSDADMGALSGIAVTSVDNSNGAWQYSTDGGSTWNAFGSPSNANARLLSADASSYVRFVPNANWNGTVSGLSFRAWDQTSGSAGSVADASANGGSTAFSSATATASITVNSVNDAPQGTSNTVTTLEDTAYVFATADFGFSDSNDSPANNLLAVKVTTLPGAGSLTDSGVAVTAGQFVSASDISSGKLVFTPAAGGWGSGYAAFTFQVEDDGGTLNAGVDTDPTPRTMTVNVDEVNHAPQGASNPVTALENSVYTFATADFGFSDPNDIPSNSLLAVKITTLPGAGSLTDNGAAVGAGQFISVADIAAGKLVFTPGANAWGNNYAAFTFQVQDDGGTLNGGVDTDPTARTMTVDVNQVNHAPQGTSNTVTTLENNVYTFASADFGFSDPNDSPSNNLLAVEVTTLPGAGSLTDNGVAVIAGQFVSVTDIAGGKLVFTPGANAWGNNCAAFTFQVQDDGGTLNAGVDTDSTARTMTVDVNQVNHAPQGTSNTVTTLENNSYTFASADFGFSDPNDSPSNTLLAVEITTLPGAGSLTDNGAAVGAGQFISVADITGGKLVFTPGLNASGAAYANFGFQVQDNGGTNNAGVDTDPAPKSMTVDVTFVNQPPLLGNNTLTVGQGGMLVLSNANLSASDVDNAAAGLVFSVSNILNGRFELVTSPGVPVTTFTQAAVTSGQVRFVDSGSATAPSFDVRVSDGSLTVGPVAANVSFSVLAPPAPVPVVPIGGPVPPPIGVPTPPTVEPAPLPPVPSGGGGGSGAPRPGAGAGPGPSGGRAPFAPEAVAAELARPARGAEPVLVQQQPPRVTLNSAPNLHPQELALLIQGSEPQSMQSGPPTKADWSAHTAFPEKGHDSEHDSIEVLMESVRMGSIALSVGVVWWASRVGGLVGSLLTSVPAWRHLDPMPIVGRDKDEAEDWDDPRDADADADELAISMVLEGPRANVPATA